jgi:hypothetical protein
MHDLVNAIEALTAATRTLAANAKPQRGLPSGVYALLGAIVGFLLSALHTWWRDNRHRAGEKRLLAGALAAELRGFLALFSEIEPPGKPVDAEGGPIITWAVGQSYTPVFDASGSRLFLPDKELLEAASVSYFKLKRALDNLAMSERLTEYTVTMGKQHDKDAVSPEKLDEMAKKGVFQSPDTYGAMAKRASDVAIETARRAVKAINEVLPKLHDLAERKGRHVQ